MPTFLEATCAPSANHRLEGCSLQPLLFGASDLEWRDAVFSEIDYSVYSAREALGVGVGDARGYMIRTEQWKYVHFKDFPPQLFDLVNDPKEFVDLGRDETYSEKRRQMLDLLMQRLLNRKNRVTMTDEDIHNLRASEDSSGILIGKW